MNYTMMNEAMRSDLRPATVESINTEHVENTLKQRNIMWKRKWLCRDGL